MEYWILGPLILLILYFVYHVFFQNYMEVRRVFRSLEKMVDSRDYFLLKLMPDLEKKIPEEKLADVLALVEQRTKERKCGYTIKIRTDIKLNKAVKALYEAYLGIETNPVMDEVFKNIMQIELKLKRLRKEYNIKAEQFNLSLIDHKFINFQIIRYKPLDLYGIQKKNE